MPEYSSSRVYINVSQCQSPFILSWKICSGSIGGVSKKTRQFNIRMSEEQRAELEEMCRRRGRPLSFQVEHLIALAKLLIEFCEGNDDLEAASQRLAEAKKNRKIR
jgi:hypothetical protein